MKILCIADIHGKLDSILNAAEFAKERGINNVIILGDFTGHGKFHDSKLNSQDALYALSTLNDSGLDVLAITGNCDSLRVLEVFNKFNANLHEKVKELSGVYFIGLGGSNPTPFNTPLEFSEQDIYNKLSEMMSAAGTENKKNIVLITHCPPKDTKCDNALRGHVGSESLRKIIGEFQPNLAVSSHIHECGGVKDKIGETTVANIGTLAEMRCGIIDTEKLDIELMRMG